MSWWDEICEGSDVRLSVGPSFLGACDLGPEFPRYVKTSRESVIKDSSFCLTPELTQR